MMWINHEIKRFELSPRVHNRLMNDLNREVMVKHGRDVVPRHFESNAKTRPGGEYGYKTRGVKYTKEKRKKFGHSKPNVYSGKLRDAVLSKIRVTSTAQRARMITRGTNEHKLADFQRREIEAMSIDEREAYARWQGSEYAKRAFDLKYGKKRRKRT